MPVRLDLGSGGKADASLGPGWLGVDWYAPNADVKAQLWSLPFGDKEVDAAFSSHALEHIPKARVDPTLLEWFRVLRGGGHLTLIVPDLEDCCRRFLADPGCGQTLDNIYGSQDRDGMEHRTGFTEETGKTYLQKAGFVRVNCRRIQSHGVISLVFECHRPEPGEIISINHCRLCGSDNISPLWKSGGFQWHRCWQCACDSSEEVYNPTMYDANYLAAHHGKTGDNVQADLLRELTTNLDLFDKYKGELREHSFLDVGCNEGAALVGMRQRGWQAWGWDCNPHAAGENVVTHPIFGASLFQRQFTAILCREVIEHCPGPRQMIAELYQACKPGGFVQIQTPRPIREPHPIPYQHGHLQLFSPLMLQLECLRAGFRIAEERTWDIGQLLMLRK